MVKRADFPFVSEPQAWGSHNIGVETAVGESLYGVYQQGKYSDLKITCQGQAFNVHKIIVSAQSKVLAAMIDSTFKEDKTAHIDIPEDEPAVIEYLVRFLYRGEYDPKLPVDWYEGEEGGSDLPCKLHAELYNLADKYDVGTLLRRAAGHYQYSINFYDYEEDNAEKHINFLSSIPIVYSIPAASDGRDLRNIASSFMSCISSVMERATGTSAQLKAMREEVIRNTPEFASDVALLLMRKASPVCESCVAASESDGPTPPYKKRKLNIGRMHCTCCDYNNSFVGINDAAEIARLEKEKKK